MKFLIFFLFVFTSCNLTGKLRNPIEVERSTLTLDRIESRYRYPNENYYVIWVDRRGMEFQEEIMDKRDTAWMKKGQISSPLIKR